MDEWIAFELSNGLLNSKMSEATSWHLLDQARMEIAASSDVHVCLHWLAASSYGVEIFVEFFAYFWSPMLAVQFNYFRNYILRRELETFLFYVNYANFYACFRRARVSELHAWTLVCNKLQLRLPQV